MDWISVHRQTNIHLALFRMDQYWTVHDMLGQVRIGQGGCDRLGWVETGRNRSGVRIGQVRLAKVVQGRSRQLNIGQDRTDQDM